MLELALDARRGSFHLQVKCRFTSAWTVVFGPSGAGKSTLLRLLAGLDGIVDHGPEHVRIALDARLLTDSARGLALTPGLRRTSMVAQQPALFPHLSVAANVAYGLHQLDRRSRSARVEEMLELVDATDLLHRRPQRLSGGEAQRVALARALAPLPRLLLLDEPFSALDGAASDALLVRLQSWLSQHGVQTVLATHDATDALATAAEVALLRDGRLTALGPATAVLAAERDRLLTRLGVPNSPQSPVASRHPEIDFRNKP
jgi:ABC-type sulfate/molybdate transport systems ATPase subunit